MEAQREGLLPDHSLFKKNIQELFGVIHGIIESFLHHT